MNRGPVLAGAGIAVGIAAAALVSTCAGPDTARSVAPSTPLDEQCGDVPTQASRLQVEASDGFDLGAAVVVPDAERDEPPSNPGAPVVVLRHGGSHTLCDWLAVSARMADTTGATVLLLDRRGQGSSPGRRDLTKDPTDVWAALDASDLTLTGRPLVVLGSSMGNASAFSLLEQLPARPCTVIGVSPVPGAGPLDGTTALRTTDPGRRPSSVHLVWAAEDGNVPAQANELADAARSIDVTADLLEVGGEAHARAVLDQHDRAMDFVLDAVSDCTEPANVD